MPSLLDNGLSGEHDKQNPCSIALVKDQEQQSNRYTGKKLTDKGTIVRQIVPPPMI